jgi:hypothetical protein
LYHVAMPSPPSPSLTQPPPLAESLPASTANLPTTTHPSTTTPPTQEAIPSPSHASHSPLEERQLLDYSSSPSPRSNPTRGNCQAKEHEADHATRKLAFKEVLLSSPAPRHHQATLGVAEESNCAGVSAPLPLRPKIQSILVRLDRVSQQSPS